MKLEREAAIALFADIAALCKMTAKCLLVLLGSMCLIVAKPIEKSLYIGFFGATVNFKLSLGFIVYS